MFFLSRMLDNKLHLPKAGEALPGRARAVATAARHHVFKRPLKAAPPEGMMQAVFGLGNFRGAERIFWRMPGVWLTAAGFSGGFTPNPTYQEVCTGLTGHAEAVLVTFDPQSVSYGELLKAFWEAHDPTQGMRQGPDIGTPYRSVVFTFTDSQLAEAVASRDAYQRALAIAGRDRITTAISPAGPFYFAEAEHQQYLAKNPGARCDLKGAGVDFPPSTVA